MKSQERLVKTITFRYRIGEIGLMSWSPKLAFEGKNAPMETQRSPLPESLLSELPREADGYFLSKVAADQFQIGCGQFGSFLYYAPYLIQHYFVVLGGSFEDYLRKFSPKSRQNIVRAAKKFSEKCDESYFRVCRTPDEISEFIIEASRVSVQTYQSRLLDAGLSQTESFRKSANELAIAGKARGYLLSMNGSVVAFAWCRVDGTRLIYDTIGYLPEFSKLSPGTVLLYLILRDLFANEQVNHLDFGPGHAPYKEMFSNFKQEYIDLYLFRNTLKNQIFSRLHLWVNHFSENLVGPAKFI
jgi:hypothetical protein